MYCDMDEQQNHYTQLKKKARDKRHVMWFYLYEISRKGKALRTKSRFMVGRVEGRGQGGQCRWTVNVLQWWKSSKTLPGVLPVSAQTFPWAHQLDSVPDLLVNIVAPEK